MAMIYGGWPGPGALDDRAMVCGESVASVLVSGGRCDGCMLWELSTFFR
jgi:hypothetical protein